MPKIALIYNPYAGTRRFPYLLDYTIMTFQRIGYDICVYRTTGPQSFADFFKQEDNREYAAIFIAGGDGSVSMLIDGLLKANWDIPIGIIPAGTANDFAYHIGMPKNLRKAVNSLTAMKSQAVDVGLVNNQFFINVCSGGVLTDISYKIDLKRKNSLGRLAYYLKGMQELPNFKSMKLSVTAQSVDISEDFYLFVVLNGSSAGGLSKLGGTASVADGLLDFIGFKAVSLTQLPLVFPKILMGDHLNDKRVIHFRASSLRIESLDNSKLESDVDGEKGPDFPLHISALPGRLQIIGPGFD